MNLGKSLMVGPGKKAGIARRDPDATPGVKNKEQALKTIGRNITRLAQLQDLLYAEAKHAVLIVIQAMDAGGKDGIVRHVMTGLNPQGCKVTPFKVPTSEERRHDFLWRIHKAVPAAGEVGIFNRSHYEDVLIVRVHKLVPKEVWSRRYEQINTFEKMLADSNVTVLKFFLHISKQEQKKRFQERIEEPTKHWKLTPADFEERKYWDDYMESYEDALTRCSTPWAPWYVLPSNHKWFRDLAASQIIVEALEELSMKYPAPTMDVSRIRLK
jgi:PPK2 family polyphosphate:nucleotide phosphotransferase